MHFPSVNFTKDEDAARMLSYKFADSLRGGEVIILIGELGAGKTFFIKNVVKELGVLNANSPSFSIVNEYSGRFKIIHFDFYRIKKAEELFDLGFNDYLNEEKAVCFIEWGNLFPEVLPHKRIEIIINVNDDFTRTYNFMRYE